MHSETDIRPCLQDDGAARFARNERRTWSVVALTGSMMIVELIVGSLTHSLALTADGWHMATHAGALGLSGLAYWYARAHATRGHLTFGTGKVYALAGYTNAVVLLLVALLMSLESVRRLAHPEAIAFGDALPVAVLGLLVNLGSVALLGVDHDHDHEEEEDDHEDHDHGHDHNLRAAYLHVLADALTSVLAIVALVGGRYFGLAFLDPLMGIVGGCVIAHWGVGLVRGSARQLLDAVPSKRATEAIRARLETFGDTKVTDLHLWQLGPGKQGCIVSLVASAPETIDAYRAAVLAVAPVAHLTVEVSRCPHPEAA